MRLPWVVNNAVKEAYHRYRNALMRAEQASREARDQREQEARAADELRDALEQIVGRIRRENHNGSG